MNKVPTCVDGRFRLGDVLGLGTYAVVYHAQNFLKDDSVAIKLEPTINHSLCNVVNLGDQLLSCLKYIHSHNFVHSDIKLQNILVGLNDLRHTAFIVDFGIAKEYCSTSTRTHVPFRQGQNLTGTPAFASINSHLRVETGRRDNIDSTMLERKVNTTIEVLCHGIPVGFASLLIYTRSLAFSQDPDYNYLRSLLHDLHATLPIPASYLLDFIIYLYISSR
ncbi:casein kinase 1 epsilon [Suillus paluster]|uniref:casein kinase 1 epsilon n=1 Tax=Suillus paluster TaxID=48578 RepID=UPI001B863648|nr:casein kinase 1 epsilon [Suillus paluster]KAG1726625.1 casein kinase 1 epsilon [Suillus paluster]